MKILLRVLTLFALIFTLSSSFTLAQSDRDGDGFGDTRDACPDTPGGAGSSDGCPVAPPPPTDRDGDGFADVRDACPDTPGGQGSADGCPVPPPPAPSDRDGDGWSDDTDRCPDTAGSDNGCPPPAAPSDRDGDGFADERDACPDTPGGQGSTDGCPAPVDQDNDGIPDPQDRCPQSAGLTGFGGCLPSIPDAAACSIATASIQRVNIRAEASLDSEIVGQLQPSQVYPVLEQIEVDGAVWYRLAEGWILGEVVRVGGQCDELPTSPAEPLCPHLRVYTADELARLEAAGITPAEICEAAEDAPDRVCDAVIASLTAAEMRQIIATGISLNRLCLLEDREDAPCPLLASLSAEQRARYEAAGINPCGELECPGLNTMSAEEQARLRDASVDTSKLCLPPLPADPECAELANLTAAERERYAIAGIDPASLCTPAQTLNLPMLVVLEIPLVDAPPAPQPTPQLFALQGKSDCKSPFTTVKLADSPYTGNTDLVISGNHYWGTACDEIIYGNAQSNILIGGGGNDIIIGYAGNDTLLGGFGNDALLGMNGDDLINGTSGDDLVLGNAGFDRLVGSTGNDILLQDGIQFDLEVATPQQIAFSQTWINVSKTWDIAGDGNIGFSPAYLNSILQQSAAYNEANQTDTDTGERSDMRGGSGRDFLVGSAQTDMLQGGTDNDWLSDFSPNSNVLMGEAGNDYHAGTGTIVSSADNMPDAVVNNFYPLRADRIANTQIWADITDVCYISTEDQISYYADSGIYECGKVNRVANISSALGSWVSIQP